jgi:4-amino-4-deoxy-L-arabinose transferase-like glycosyltransferase
MAGRQGWAAAVTAIGVAGVAALWLHWSPLGANDLVGGDEGYYGTLARNLLAERAQWLSPSLTPLGPPGDKPPLYPALLALSVAGAGPNETALRWPSVALAALIALGVGVLAARAAGAAGLPGARWTGPAAAAVLMTLPWYGDASRSAISDIPMTAAGVAALVVVTGGAPTLGRALAGGALLGVAFQCKLWLAGVFALPAVLAVWTGGGARPALALLAAAAGVGSLHLAAVALFEPARLGHWVDVYLRRMLAERVGDTGSVYARPATYYGTLLAHALVLALPLAGLGLDRLRRHAREPAALATLVGCAAFLALSAFTVKSAVYLYALLPAWAVAAAVGAGALAAGAARPGPVTVALAIASLPPLARALGGEPPPTAVWAGAWLATLAALAIARARPGWARVAALVLCLLAVGGGLARQSRRLPARYHDPGYREVAAALAPRLASAPPGRPSFVAPEAPAFAYPLFRTGLYWATPHAPWTRARRDRILGDSALRAFVVDPARIAYGGWPDSATVAWLERSTREITPEIAARAGRPLAVRVFVREPAPPAAARGPGAAGE